MRQELLVSYSFAKSIYDEKRNLLDSFAPFVLEAFSRPPVGRSHLDIDEVSEILSKDFSLTIPSNTLISITDHLGRDEYLSGGKREFQTSPNYQIAPKGTTFLREVTGSLSDIRRRQNKFIAAFCEYYRQEEGAEINVNDARTFIENFIKRNLGQLVIFNYGEDDLLADYDLEDGTIEGMIESPQIEQETEYCFLKWLEKVGKENPDEYEILTEWLRGAVLWNEIASRKNLAPDVGFNDMDLYLDTNFIISLLGYHHPFINKAAKQLYDQLQSNPRIHLKVFSITLQEIFRLLRNFKGQKNNYTNFNVNSFFYFLHCAKLSDSDVDELIDGLEEILLGLGINKIDIEEIEPTKLEGYRKDLYQRLYSFRLEKFKNRKRERAIERAVVHDLSIWFAVEDRRSSSVTGLENCEALFLTSSFYLNLFARQEASTEKYPAVIRDLTLTNTLWLKSPAKDQGISVDSVIAIHCKKLIIDERIWKQFIETMLRLKAEGKVNEAQFARMISYNQATEHYLLRTRPKEFAAEELLRLAKQQEEYEKKRAAAEKEKENQLEKSKTELNAVQAEKAKLEAERAEQQRVEAQKQAQIEKLEQEKQQILQTSKEKDLMHEEEKLQIQIAAQQQIDQIAQEVAAMKLEKEDSAWEERTRKEFLEKIWPRKRAILRLRVIELGAFLGAIGICAVAGTFNVQILDWFYNDPNKIASWAKGAFIGVVAVAGIFSFYLGFFGNKDRYQNTRRYLYAWNKVKNEELNTFLFSKGHERPKALPPTPPQTPAPTA